MWWRDEHPPLQRLYLAEQVACDNGKWRCLLASEREPGCKHYYISNHQRPSTNVTWRASSFLACNSRLSSAICRHHPPQRAVLSQTCCFGERKVVLFQILLDGAEPVMHERPGCLVQSAGRETNRILLASALSSMRTICPNRVSRHDWIIAVSLGFFVSLHTSSFRTNWYHLMPSSIRRHHWSSTLILHASASIKDVLYSNS